MHFVNAATIAISVLPFVLERTPNDASMFVKAFFGREFGGFAGCCWGGKDRDGPLLVEGRLYQVTKFSSFGKGPGRPADRSKASTSAAAD